MIARNVNASEVCGRRLHLSLNVVAANPHEMGLKLSSIANGRLPLLLGEVASGVRAVPVAVGEGGAGAEAAAADVEVLAGGAGTGDELLALQRVVAAAQFLELSSGGLAGGLPYL